MRQRNGRDPTSRSHIDDQRVVFRFWAKHPAQADVETDEFKRLLHQELRAGPRHERAPIDDEVQAHEISSTEHVVHRFVRRPTLYEFNISLCLFLAEGNVTAGMQVDSSHLQHTGEKQVCVKNVGLDLRLSELETAPGPRRSADGAVES